MHNKEAMYLGLDCGTQATKALLIDYDGVALGRGHARHSLIEASNGRREQEPAWWIEAAVAATRQAIAKAGSSKLLGIGVSGQQHGLVVLDEECQVIRPAKLWNDTETAGQNRTLLAAFGGPQEWQRRFGIAPLTGYTVSKLLWLRDHEPQNFARIRHILLPHDYLNFYLTGRIVTECGDASGTGYFNPRTRKWIPEVLDFIDQGSGHLVKALPPLLSPGEVVGRVLPVVAARLGVDADAVVATGGGDNMMGAIGTGNLRPGIVTVSLGTSSTVYSFRESPQEVEDAAIAPFCSSSGGWLPLVCTMNCTNVLSGTLALVARDVKDVDQALDATEAGADGLTFIPFLNGERTPDLPEATGSLLGVTAINYDAQHLIRATIEGVSFGIVAGIERILGAASERILTIGGGARSLGWRQLLSDLTGSIIDVPVEEEAACLGAAIQAIYTFEKLSNEAADMSAIADRCVAVNLTKRVSRTDRTEDYSAAYDLYRQRLARFYGEM